MPIKVPGRGPSNAEVMIIGEAPGKEECDRGEPFVGASGVEMTRMIHQVGIIRSECYITNVCKYRPPNNKIDAWFYTKTAANKNPHKWIHGKYVHPYIFEGLEELEKEIALVDPKVIIAFGNTPLWALTGHYGITKWRGSGLLSREIAGKQYPVVPTYHPAAIVRGRWDWRYIAVHDLRKARRIRELGLTVREEDFLVRPSYRDTVLVLSNLINEADTKASAYPDGKMDIAVDIETRRGHITCVGLAWADSRAISIPFLEVKNPPDYNYWSTLEEETEVVFLLRQLLTHRNVRVIGQHFTYDQQYFARHFGFIPNFKPENFHDVMTFHHVLFAGLPKGLDFQSSFYLDDHVYWKEEGKEWDPKYMSEEQHWVYNCKDCVNTYAIAQEQRNVYEQLNFTETSYGSPIFIQHRSHEPVLRAMLRGIKADLKKKTALAEECDQAIHKREEHINYLAGHPLNPRSPQQLSKFFYDDFGVKPVTVYDRASGKRRRTCNADALDTIAKREILLAPICHTINETRSLSTFRSVARQNLDADNRFRCAYTVPGTETYRYNSKEDAFGFGTNLQNISKGNEDDKDVDPEFITPNLRRMMIPDEGYIICKHDLEQSDARVVAWESGCESLKEIFRDPTRDLHNENTEIIFGRFLGPGDPNRQKAKIGVHAVNYGATARVVAAALGITVHEAERFIARYFGERPEIQEWQERIRLQLQTRRYVENVFGYRRFYFDRIEDLLKEALAWIGQSTTSITINLGILQVQDQISWAEFLLQVHDDAVHQFPKSAVESPQAGFDQIKEAMAVTLPFDDPMIIPVAGGWSEKSWGDCKG